MYYYDKIKPYLALRIIIEYKKQSNFLKEMLTVFVFWYIIGMKMTNDNLLKIKKYLEQRYIWKKGVEKWNEKDS